MKKSSIATATAMDSTRSETSQAQAKELTIFCGAVGEELTLCQESAAASEKKTGHSVDVVSTLNSSTERLSLYQQILSANSSDIDVMQINVVWPGLLVKHLLDLKKVLGDDDAAGHFDTIVTIDARLVAMQWLTDANVLYYREALLETYVHEVPKPGASSPRLPTTFKTPRAPRTTTASRGMCSRAVLIASLRDHCG